MGIGDWGLGIGDWAHSPIPNPQSPIPIPNPLKAKEYNKNNIKNKIKCNQINSIINKLLLYVLLLTKEQNPEIF